MDLAIEGFLGLGINVSLADKATESGLNMCTGAAETVIKVEVAEGRIKIVPPEQGHYTAPEPYTFRIAGRSGKGPGGFRDFVNLFLAFLGGIGGWFRRLGGLSVAAALREGGDRET